MRRRLLIVVLAELALVLAAAVATIIGPRADRVTEANFQRVQEGMSRAEVEAILGPADDYTTGPTILTKDGFDKVFFMIDERNKSVLLPVTYWFGDSAVICVVFNTANTVDAKSLDGNSRRSQSILDDFRWRAKRQWRRWFS
jgi:hypothetical protein